MVKSEIGSNCYDVFTIMVMFVLARHGTCTTESGQLEQAYRSWIDNTTAVEREQMGLEIEISHDALDVNKGYVANMQYVVSLSSFNETSRPIGRLQLASVISSSPNPIGGFSQVTNDNSVPSNQLFNPINLIWSADVNRTITSVNTVYWLSPEVTSGCITFVLLAELEQPTIIATKDFCPREGCIHHLKSIKGKVHSPDYPRNYPDNSNCLIILDVPRAYRIKIQFQVFHLENAYQGKCVDYVTVGSSELTGPHESSVTSLRQLCGHYEDEDLKKLSFISDQNFFIINFRSDNKLSGSGFLAVFYAVDETGQPETCTRMINFDKHTVNSPYYPDVYVPNLHCTVTLMADEGLTLMLKIISMNLQPAREGTCLDYLLIEGAMEEQTPLCGTYSKECDSPLVYESTSSNLTLTFHSDFLREASGFEAVYAKVSPCSDVIVNELNGTLTSSNYPMAYPNNENCTATINVTEPWLDIQLQILFLDTQIEFGTYGSGEKCTTDYLELYDGRKWERRCGRWSGKEYLLKFQSEGPMLLVRFVSDGERHCTGYEARWQAVVNDSSLITCSDGWLSFNDYCLWIADGRVTWQQAADLCHDNGSYLATINNGDIHQFISDTLRSSDRDNDAFWIGANDRIYEADFYWDNGVKVEYNGWFPGWSQYHFYNRQPNDDGLSNEDCVEIRNWFSFPSKGGATVDQYYWNDRSCDVRNGYICQKLKPELLPLVRQHQPDCSMHIFLTSSRRRGILSSPGYPLLYDNFLYCNVTIEAPDNYVIQLEFNDFVLESDDRCRYDYLKITSLPVPYGGEVRGSRDKIYCGDWSGKTKLLRYVSLTSVLKLTFVTDHSRVFRGFKARYEIVEPRNPCDHGWYYDMERELCLSVNRNNDMQMTYDQAADFCQSQQASVLSLQNKRGDDILRTLITAQTNASKITTFWINNSGNAARALVPSYAGDNRTNPDIDQAMTSTVDMTLSCLLYRHEEDDTKDDFILTPVRCDELANVICERSPGSAVVHSLNGTFGTIAVPASGEGSYSNNMHILWRITAPVGHRILISIDHLDIEPQRHCLYDYLLIIDPKDGSNKSSETRRFCGRKNDTSDWSMFSNTAEVEFVSDYVTTASGFVVQWEAIEVHDVYVYNDNVGVVTSLNYPKDYLDNLHYKAVIRVDDGRRVFIKFESFDLSSTNCRDYVDLDLGRGTIQRLCGRPLESNSCQLQYMTYDNQLVLTFNSDAGEHSAGFKLRYESVPAYGWQTEEDLFISESDKLLLCAINFPAPQPSDIVTTYNIRAELGTQIKVEANGRDNCLHDATTAKKSEAYIMIHDKYAPSGYNWSTLSVISCRNGPASDDTSSVTAISYINYLTVRFHSGMPEGRHQPLSLEVISIPDVAFINKTKTDLNISVDTCTPSPCYHGGRCYKHDNADWFSCQCHGHYIGLLCAWSYCDLDNLCQHGGLCTNTETSYNCTCGKSYSGQHCEVSLNSCSLEYCFGHGQCEFDENWQKYCQCDHGRVGPRCASYLPVEEFRRSLSARLLDEPFWIGIIVVALLSLITSIVVLIKRKCHCRSRCRDIDEQDKNSTLHGEETNGMKSVFRRYRTGKKYESSVNGILNQVYSSKFSMSTDPSRFMIATAAITCPKEVKVPITPPNTEEAKQTTSDGDVTQAVDGNKLTSVSGDGAHIPSTHAEPDAADVDDDDYLEPINIDPYLPESSESENDELRQNVYPEGIDLASGHRLSVVSIDRRSGGSPHAGDQPECVRTTEAIGARHPESSWRANGAQRRMDYVSSARSGRRDPVAWDQESHQSSEGSAYHSCGSACSLSKSGRDGEARRSRMPQSVSYSSLDCLRRDPERGGAAGERRRHRHRPRHQRRSGHGSRRKAKDNDAPARGSDGRSTVDGSPSFDVAVASRRSRHRTSDCRKCAVPDGSPHRGDTGVRVQRTLSFSPNHRRRIADVDCLLNRSRLSAPSTLADLESDKPTTKSGMEARRDSFLNIFDAGFRGADFTLVSPSGGTTTGTSRAPPVGAFNPLASSAELLDVDAVDPSTSIDSAVSVNSNPSENNRGAIHEAADGRHDVGDSWLLPDVDVSQMTETSCRGVAPPDESPVKDSAYQSKDVSTEWYTANSRSNSNTVSPTLNSNCCLRDTEQYDVYKAVPHREEDKRVTNQLELAARKLKAISEESCREEDGDHHQYLDLDHLDRYIMSAVYPSHVTPASYTKIRRTFPSRMLSMIMDEEGECDTPPSVDADTAADGATRTSRSQGSRSVEVDGPKQSMSREYGSSLGGSTALDTDVLDLDVFCDGEINDPVRVDNVTEQTEV